MDADLSTIKTALAELTDGEREAATRVVKKLYYTVVKPIDISCGQRRIRGGNIGGSFNAF